MARYTALFTLACFALSATVSALPHNAFLLSTGQAPVAQPAYPNVYRAPAAGHISDSHTSNIVQYLPNGAANPNSRQIVTNNDRELAAYLDDLDLDDEFTKRDQNA